MNGRLLCLVVALAGSSPAASAELSLSLHFPDYYWDFTLTHDLIELRNLATVARLIVDSARERRESRGLHYNIDHPRRDDKNWKKDIVLKRGKGEFC